MYETFVRRRITELRLKKGVSEYEMSYALGHSRGYIYNISSGKCLPPLKEFFAICEYLEVSPAKFFDEEIQQPILVQQITEDMKNLSDSDLLLVMHLVQRLKK